MTTTERQPEPLRARRNTLQRMLDLEKRNKVNRMQAAAHPPSSHHTSTIQGRDSLSNLSRPHLEQGATPLNPHRRTMTAPELSVSTPAKLGNGATKYVIGSYGDAIPAEMEKSEDDGSDASSICHSPGWDDLSGKKRKQEKKEKERRKKEKEKLMMAPKKLSKSHPPSASRRLTKFANVMDRTKSTPIVPGSNDVQESEERNKVPERARRGSIEIGLKSLMNAKKALQTPWKSSQTAPATPTQDTSTPTQDTSTLNSSLNASLSKSTSGFIGGLKLRQSEEANSKEVIRQLKLAHEEEGKGPLDSGSTTPRRGETTSSGTSIAESMTRATSIYEESIRTPDQWDSLYAEAARLARNTNDKIVDEDVPIMERNIRKPRKSQPPVSKYFDGDDSTLGKRDTSAASSRISFQSGLRSSGDDGSHGRTPFSAFSSEKPAPSKDMSAERPESDLVRGRTATSYVQHSRQQNHDQSIGGFQKDYAVTRPPAVPRKSSSRGRSIFNRSRSRARKSSPDAPPTGRPGSGAGTKSTGKDGEVVNPCPSQDDLQPHVGPATKSPTESKFSHHPKSSFSAAGIRNAAKAAFTKSYVATDSGSDSYQSSAEIVIATSRSPAAKRAVTTEVSMSRVEAPVKSERILGETTSPTSIQDFAVPAELTRRNGLAGRQVNTEGTSSSSSSSRQITEHDHSNSLTDSSDEYSTPDEFSNITTPAVSRPHSEKGCFPSVETTNVRDTFGNAGASKSSLSFSQEAMMTGGVPFDDANESGQESWCRTALPMEMTEDEDRMKTPTGKKEPTDHVTSTTPPVPESLDRKPSLSRSTSTPELQDLSFLPPLKHQALTRRPPKEKSKMRRSRQKSDPKSSPRPPPIPIPTTKSEGSSPTSPLSSQYLQNARLSLPRPTGPRAGSPSKLFGHNPQPGPGGPDPIAKMFVVCCSCKYFHDMPSKIYECMAKPDNLVRDPELGVSGVISTSVKCPWCGHGMSTSCCAGYAAVVYLREKVH